MIHNEKEKMMGAKKILIVDDNALMIEVLTYILMNNGYEVTALSSGSDVFKNIKATHPDLVILEDILPGLDGREICKLLKLNKTTQNLPVIMCSGDEAIDASLKDGAPDDILHKPFDIKRLIQLVEHRLAA